MITYSLRNIIIILSLVSFNFVNCQNTQIASITGFLNIDNSWDRTIYLSHIQSFDDMYLMSNEIIIARTKMDSLGYFQFNIDFLPEEATLLRLHITKKEDSPATLVIGGKDENHMFLLANRFTGFHLTNTLSHPPFRNVTFLNSPQNTSFQQISQMVYLADSIASQSDAAKRKFILNNLQNDLLYMADTSNDALTSLYAIYKSKFESNYVTNTEFYKSYLKKWKGQDNAYFRSFKKQLHIKTTDYDIFKYILLSIIFVSGFVLGKYGIIKKNGIEKLSIQERKIFELLKQGASNQEISNQHNIGISTVKSHVSSIYSKLNIKSRKDIVDI